MADSLRSIVRRLARVERMAVQANTQPQLADSAIMDGALQAWSEGNVRGIFGKQYDGTTAIAIVNGPKPPKPTAPTALPALEGAKIFWDGLFTDALVAPMDFARAEIHAGAQPDFSAEFAGTLVGTFETPRGGELFVSLVPADYYIRLVVRTASGGRSEPSDAVLVRPTAIEDVVAIDPGDRTPPDSSPEISVEEVMNGLVAYAQVVLPPRNSLIFEVALDPGFASIVLTMTVQQTSVLLTPLPAHTDLYVRVTATNAAGPAVSGSSMMVGPRRTRSIDPVDIPELSLTVSKFKSSRHGIY